MNLSQTYRQALLNNHSDSADYIFCHEVGVHKNWKYK